MARYSANYRDPGYKALRDMLSAGKVVRVFLDGEEQRSAVTADDEEGIVVRNVLDAEGRKQVDPEDSERIWQETVRGKVEIKIEDCATA